MQCPQCQHENREGRRFCAECGSPLNLACSACACVNEPGEKFCGGCGKSLTASTSVLPAQQGEWAETRFQALLPAVIGQLQGQKRVTYRTLKYIFGLNDARLDEIREELTFKQFPPSFPEPAVPRPMPLVNP